MEYYLLFEKTIFPAQVEGLTAWISYLGEKKLKPKIIKAYLVRL